MPMQHRTTETSLQCLDGPESHRGLGHGRVPKRMCYLVVWLTRRRIRGKCVKPRSYNDSSELMARPPAGTGEFVAMRQRTRGQGKTGGSKGIHPARTRRWSACGLRSPKPYLGSDVSRASYRFRGHDF